ncbi:MAG: hypothetical protein IJ011_06730 [Clostridia bacterium]|nr:hypothetical protein [Clostridia bacterium]
MEQMTPIDPEKEEEPIRPVTVDPELVAKTEGQVIDIYLIAGQSNACGYTTITSDFKNSNSVFKDGYSNVLYSGNSANSSSNVYEPYITTLQKTTAGLGRYADGSYSGPELGMAEALSSYYNTESGKMACIVKYAIGGVSLRDNITGRDAAGGNWAPPSYLESIGGGKDDNLSGGQYRKFIHQVKCSIAELEAHGYTVNVKGLYWMQGEADHQYPDLYATIFNYFVSDIRNDLGEITGANLSTMPIIVGAMSSTYHRTHATATDTFIAKQIAICDSLDNVYFNNSAPFSPSRDSANDSDQSHWTSDDNLFIGEMVGTKLLNLCCGQNYETLTLGENVASVYDANGQLIASYASLAYAINSAPEGATVKLLKDVTLYAPLNLSNQNKVTLDGNGHKINTYATYIVIRLVGTDLTFKNVELVPASGSLTSLKINKYDNAVFTVDGGNLGECAA